jgi:DNA-binding transcriptional LysR family regulator
MVRQLEEELGVQLIDRSGPRARPTEPGLVVYQRGLDMLAMRDELLAQIGEFDSLKRGVLRTGVPTVGATCSLRRSSPNSAGAIPKSGSN